MPLSSEGGGGVHPFGIQPSGGLFKVKAPTKTNIKYIVPKSINIVGMLMAANALIKKLKINAPAPKPATAIPFISPFLSGNHLLAHAMGQT